MKSAYEIFEEYVVLSMTGEKRIPGNKLIDVLIGDNVVARQYNGNLTITYLTTGTFVKFPCDLFMLFKGFADYGGKEVLAINKVKKGDNVSKFIILFTKLVTILKHTNNTIPPDDLIQKICETGSKEFREWFDEKFRINLSPILYSSLSNNIAQL